MKKVIVLCLVGLFLTCNVWAQSSYSANASPVTVSLSAATPYVNITFPYTTRMLFIRNADSVEYVNVDLKSATNTTDTASCALIGPSSQLLLRDFATDGVSILRALAYSGDVEASPITIIGIW